MKSGVGKMTANKNVGLRRLACIAEIFVLASVTLAQLNPSSAGSTKCPRPNSSESSFAEISGRNPAQTFYPFKKDCSPETGTCDKGPELPPGWPVDLFFQDGDWSCIWSQDASGSGPAWLRSDRLKLVTVDVDPPVSGWPGSWWPLGAKPKHGVDHFLITESKLGALHVHGSAYWYGVVVDGSRLTHFGEVDGDGQPKGNKLHITGLDKKGDPDGCEVSMLLVDGFLKVSDNHQCGGMNVRFWGFYIRHNLHSINIDLHRLAQ
jgi:hypothetical protein